MNLKLQTLNPHRLDAQREGSPASCSSGALLLPITVPLYWNAS